MNKKKVGLYLIIFVMGGMSAVMNSSNGFLSGYIGLIESVLFVHLVGLVMATILFITLGKKERNSIIEVFKRKPYIFLGGVIGSVAVISVSYGIQNIGVFLVSMGLITGQFFSSLIIDFNGLFGFKKVRITKAKVASVVVMALGVIMISL